MKKNTNMATYLNAYCGYGAILGVYYRAVLGACYTAMYGIDMEQYLMLIA